jgi:hypothetical protein
VFACRVLVIVAHGARMFFGEMDRSISFGSGPKRVPPCSHSSPTLNKLYCRRLKRWGHIRLWWKQYQVEREGEGGGHARGKIVLFAN